MKILVIGQSLIDHINYRDKSEVKPGGIFYSILGLRSFINKTDEIFLVTSVEKEKLNIFSPYYDDLDKTYFQYIPSMPKVTLSIFDNEERTEHYSKVNQSLNIELNNISSFDGILINMITGFDITLEQLKEIRKSCSAPIFFDVHTLARGLDNKGMRNFRIIPVFEKWAENIDILQVNENEFSFLFDDGDKRSIINRLLNSGIKILIITKGERGVRAYYKKDNEILSIFISAIRVNVRNKVGCGDVFGSAFFYNYIYAKNIDKALMLANMAAGITAGYDKQVDFENLRKDIDARIY